ncbi:hypothetical protein [Herbaspirillum sp. RV1423]|uniref:hypothetical protein n=1 Tax=Herbaspirillum sp. RV1423 TaxID=1443993 RepID=UPI0005516EE4|nr:hypothetical protein [Herbaspirillum sp. RV1423]
MKTVKDVALTERLRDLIVRRFGERGKFRLLEEASGIGESKWKNIYYRKQEATAEIIDFWSSRYPEDEVWLKTGKMQPREDEYPFLAPVATTWEGQTIGDRLNWVITEWASPVGEELTKYLEGRSNKKVSALQWQRVIMRLDQPSVEMINVVCKARPMFLEWVHFGGIFSPLQVDPSDKESIAEWKKHEKRNWKIFERAITRTINEQSEKEDS